MGQRSRRRGIAAGTVLGLLAALAVSAPAGASSSAGAQPSTVIAVDATGNQGTVSPAALGHVYGWEIAGLGGFNIQANGYYAKFLHQVSDVIQPGSLRWPGGTEADLFHWQRAVGPQAQRTPNAYAGTRGPSPSNVGPDEFGQLLDTTHAAGVVATNFATGSAAEAADLVAYMTGAPGSSRWADLRARNGHPQPYNVPYWEVGNEETGATFWRSGTPVIVGGPPGACRSVATCLYIYGGSTQFTGQPVVGYADRTPAAAESTDAANQNFYVAYPPVTPGSATVYVDGTAWTQVDSLATAGPDDHVYTLDPATGKITFGDGTHGAIPESGAQVTASYVSGPHDGFVQYYQAMKAANPRIKVCSATNNDPSGDFIASMGSTLPYDCLEYHQYVAAGRVANSTPITNYQNDVMAVADTEAQEAANQQASIRVHAGHDVPLVATEYGQLLSSNPDGYPYYHDSLDEALLNASELASFIRLGIPVGDRQILTGEIPPPDQCCAALPGHAPFATTGAIGTPGPNTVVEATGLAYHLFAPLSGGTLLPVQAIGNPTLTGTTHALSLLAVRTPQYVYLLGINRSTTDPVDARVLLQGVQVGQPALGSTLNGPSSLSYNTPAAPETVRLSASDLPGAGSNFTMTFPAHSITTVRLPAQPTPSSPLSLTLSAQPAVLPPGGQLTLHADVRNDSDTPAQGEVTAFAPNGWTTTPARAPYAVGPHSTAQLNIGVTVPSDAAQQNYQLAAALGAPDGTIADIASTSVTVPFASLAAGFNNVGITDPATRTSAAMDGSHDSFDAAALAAAGLVPGASITRDGLTFTWPDAPAGQPDNAVAAGQVIALPAGTQRVGLLATSINSTSTGQATYLYANGSTQPVDLTVSYWRNAQPSGDNQLVARVSTYRDDKQQGSGSVFYVPVPSPTPGSRQPTAIALPNNSNMHIFAIATIDG